MGLVILIDMMIFRYRIFVIGVLLFGVFSCGRKAGVPQVDEPVVVEEVVKEEEEVVVEENPVVEEERVYVLCEIQRSSCYGKCPSYSIKLFSDGRAIYHGKANVDKQGYFEAFCNPQNFEEIFTAAEQANYFVMRSQYPVDGRTLPDLPKTITYLKRNGLDKRVIDNFDAPVSLVRFENWLDDFFDGLDWKKVEG